MEVAEILGSIDIVEYISQYIRLERRGREYWGLSCFTNEKTPSFSVDPEKGCWWDYSSAKGGNLAQFVIEHDHVSIAQAVRILKRYAGIALDSDIDISKDKNIAKLCSYARVYWVKNRDGLLQPKDSPVDRGEVVWRKLYEARSLLS